METSLHRQLKLRYAQDAQTEVRLDDYRIDAVSRGRLVEIQHGSLAAIRDKIADLLRNNRVLVVKPIIVEKVLIKQIERGGQVDSRRKSSKRGKLLDLFDELVYFTRVFPHRRLTLEVPLVDIEELRYPGHGRRRRWRANDYQIEDQRLVSVRSVHRFRTAADLARLMPGELPEAFHTGHLAAGLGVSRHVAQRIAYCLRHMGAVRSAGKQGNALLYRLARRAKPPACAN
jgi:hypothetical protein